MQESSCQCERPSQSTCVQRLVVKKLWVGRGPTTAKDAATIRTRRRRCKGRGIDEQRRRGDSLVQMRERKVQMTVDRVLRAQVIMMMNRRLGLGDCWMTEILLELPVESVFGISHCLVPGSSGGPDALLERSFVGFGPFVLMSVLSGWKAAVLVGVLHDERANQVGWTARGR